MKKLQFPNKDTVIGHMKTGIVNFKFEKKDGDLREMNATLISSAIDPRFHKEQNPNPYGANPDHVTCWDVDQQGWRSFNISSLKEYNGKVKDV